MSKGTYYITTPIYYPSDRLHIGHAYTTTAADALARWNRFVGKDVFFLTGSDEHGQKIERAAKEKGKDPDTYVTEIVATFQELWQRLEISYDEFIRTTQPRHKEVVQAIFKRLYEKGDIYKSQYQGLYCTPCESFWRENKLIDGRCPDCGREVELLREESYFFRLSKYAGDLLRHIEENPDFIQPTTRRNEMVSFIKSGLEDLCVSRTTFDWGIPVPIDEQHVIYVWIDALTNYLTGIGYLQDDDQFQRYWPADVHLVGKDILRFHTIIWPIILMAAELPLPRKVFGHGWLLVEHGKMSKSKRNVVDPHALMDEFGVDAIRYFLLREVSFGQDASFSRRGLMERINADLANDLGNLLHRSLAMLGRYFHGQIPTPGPVETIDGELAALADGAAAKITDQLDRLELNLALAEIWKVVNRANKYIDEVEPWTLARDEARRERLQTVLYNVFEAQRIVTLLISSFLPETARKIWDQLGITESLAEQKVEAARWGGLKPGTVTRKGDPLFPRIDLAAEEVEEAEPAPAAEAVPVAPAETVQVAPAAEAAQSTQNAAAENGADAAEITIDDFAKVDLRLARVLAAERVKGADKLLKLQVDVGSERRQVVAGIAQHFDPEALVGRKVVVVFNLKAVKLRGEISQGMVLAAEDAEGRLDLLTVDRDLPPGSKVR